MGFEVDPTMPNGYDVNITGDGAVKLDLCNCCYYDVTWHLKCTAPSVDHLNVVTRREEGQLLDRDAITVHQGGPPCISAGIDVFPGWYSYPNSYNGSDLTKLGTTEKKRICTKPKLLTVVIPVTNIGEREAQNVNVSVGMTGAFDSVEHANNNSATQIIINPTTGEVTTTPIDFSSGTHTFNIGSLDAGESYKIILQIHCAGDLNVTISVPEITATDAITLKPVDCIHKPQNKLVKQIPICVNFINPSTTDGWDAGDYGQDVKLPVSTKYTVKVEIKKLQR